MGRHRPSRRRVALATGLAIALAVPLDGARDRAAAFWSPCTSLGQPQDFPECPVADTAHNAQEQPRVDLEDQILKKHIDNVKQATNQLAATGSSGSTNPGQPGSGADLTGGQAVSAVTSSATDVQGQVAQFYFGDNSTFQGQTLNGNLPSNYAAAASSAANADIVDTIFALQAKKQTEKDSQEVTQLASQAGSTTSMRKDMGFANKVRAKLVQVLMLRAALEARLLEIRTKNVAFHLTSDQTPDSASGDLQGPASSTAASPATSSATTPGQAALAGSVPAASSAGSTPIPLADGSVETSSASPLTNQLAPPGQAAALASAAAAAGQASLAAAQAVGGAAANASTPAAAAAPATAPAVQAATAALVAAVGGSSSDPSSSATFLENAYDSAPGDSADKIRQVSLSLSDSPASFGLTGAVDQSAVVTALAGYATAN